MGQSTHHQNLENPGLLPTLTYDPQVTPCQIHQLDVPLQGLDHSPGVTIILKNRQSWRESRNFLTKSPCPTSTPVAALRVRVGASRGSGQLQHRKLPSRSWLTRIQRNCSFNHQPPACGRQQALVKAHTRHVPSWMLHHSHTSASGLLRLFLPRLILLCPREDVSREEEAGSLTGWPCSQGPGDTSIGVTSTEASPWAPWVHQLAEGNIPLSAPADDKANTLCWHAQHPSPQLTSSSFVSWAVSRQALVLTQSVPAAKRQCGAAQEVLLQHAPLG